MQGGRLPAVEILLNSKLISEIIEQGRLSEIRDAMEQSLSPGSQTFERALVDLVRSKRVSLDEALAQADSPTNLLWLLENADPQTLDPIVPPTPMPRPGAAPAAGNPPVNDGPSFSDFMLNV